MNPRPSARRALVIALSLAALTLVPSIVAAQDAPDRVTATSLGRAQLDLPGVTTFRVGTFGGGLDELERRRPEIGPLATRFRTQRRTGIVLGIAAVATGLLAFERFAGDSRTRLELGDPAANLLLGSMGTLTFAAIQLEASERTLHRIADGFRDDGSYQPRGH